MNTVISLGAPAHKTHPKHKIGNFVICRWSCGKISVLDPHMWLVFRNTVTKPIPFINGAVM